MDVKKSVIPYITIYPRPEPRPVCSRYMWILGSVEEHRSHFGDSRETVWNLLFASLIMLFNNVC